MRTCSSRFRINRPRHPRQPSAHVLRMAKRIILCDLDSTLLDKRYELTVPLETLVNSVSAKQDEGYIIGLNSDTPLLPLQTWARRFGMQGPLLAEKGQVLCPSPEVPAQVYGKLPDLFNSLRNQVMLRAREEFNEAFVGVGDVTEFVRQGAVYGVDRAAILINGYRRCSFSGYALACKDGRLSAQDARLFERFCELVLSIAGEYAEQLDEPDKNPDYGIMVLHERGASKSLAVERLITQTEGGTGVVMIGDSDADIINSNAPVMLCAVGNASPDLKAKARESGGVVADKAYTEGVLEILSLI